MALNDNWRWDIKPMANLLNMKIKALRVISVNAFINNVFTEPVAGFEFCPNFYHNGDSLAYF